MIFYNPNHIYFKEDMKNAIEKTCNIFSESTAFSFLKDDGSLVKWSYADAFEEIKKIEAFYKQMKFKDHDRVAVIMPSTPYAAFSVLGLAYSGAIIVPIDVSLPISEIERLLIYADVAGVVLTESVYENLSADFKENYPFLMLDKNYEFSIVQNGKTTARECDVYDNDPENLVIIFSSGTSSKMEGVCLSYKSMMESPLKFPELAGVKYGKVEKAFFVYPINHISGFEALTLYFFVGYDMCMIETINPSNLMKGFKLFNPYYFGFIPKFFEVISSQINEKIAEAGKIPLALFHSMLNLNGFLRKHFRINIGPFIFKKIRHSVFGNNMFHLAVGATTCKPETEAFFWNLGYAWSNLYASTESGAPAVTSGYKDKYPVGNLGNVDRFSSVNVKVVSKDVDGIGEICIKSECMMMGYFRDPERTKRAFDDDGYLITGDLGYIDSENRLHITGRKKDVILMRNGKKASPDDLENIYSEKTGDIPIAVCGIPGRDGYDEIHLFVKSDNPDMKAMIADKLSDVKGVYKISEIHVIQNIPTTRTGKVKRAELIKSLLEGENNNYAEDKTVNHDFSDIEEILSSLVGKDASSFDDNQSLVDIGVDSISMLELVTNVEQKYHINISNQLVKIQTVGDLKRTVKLSSGNEASETAVERVHYPIPRTDKQIKKFEKKLSKWPKQYNISVFNAQRIDPNRQCIICLNHQSNVDSMPVLNILRDKGADLSKIAFVVGHHLLKNEISRRTFESIGCIPIDRFVNTTPAFEDMSAWIEKGNTLMIHPEGYLSVDGTILPFKKGAAKLAIDNNVPILPIRIDGTRIVLPKGTYIPKKKVNGKKIKINIAVGDYIEPSGYDVTSLTEATRNQILSLSFSNK